MAMSARPHILFIYFPVFISWVGIISCPFLFFRQQCVPPKSFRELTLDVGPGENSAQWAEWCGVLEADHQRAPFFWVWSLHTLAFPEQGLCGSWQTHYLARDCRSVCDTPVLLAVLILISNPGHRENQTQAPNKSPAAF